MHAIHCVAIYLLQYRVDEEVIRTIPGQPSPSDMQLRRRRIIARPSAAAAVTLCRRIPVTVMPQPLCHLAVYAARRRPFTGTLNATSSVPGPCCSLNRRDAKIENRRMGNADKPAKRFASLGFCGSGEILGASGRNRQFGMLDLRGKGAVRNRSCRYACRISSVRVLTE